MNNVNSSASESGISVPYYDGADLESLTVLNNYQNWIISIFAPYLTGNITEYGAGTGNISQLLASFAERLTLVEPSPNLIPILQAKFDGDEEVTVVADTLEAAVAATEAESCDAIVIVNVLEHIEDDVTSLKELHRTLKPGGTLLIFVPALPFLYSALDKKFGHFRRYRLDELRSKCLAAGFVISTQRYFDVLGVLPWWLINRVMGATTFSDRLAIIYDRIFVPIGRMMESVIRPPIGKNIVMIAHRPRRGVEGERTP